MAGSIDKKIIETVFKNSYIGSSDVQKFIADLAKLTNEQKNLQKQSDANIAAHKKELAFMQAKQKAITSMTREQVNAEKAANDYLAKARNEKIQQEQRAAAIVAQAAKKASQERIAAERRAAAEEKRAIQAAIKARREEARENEKAARQKIRARQAEERAAVKAAKEEIKAQNAQVKAAQQAAKMQEKAYLAPGDAAKMVGRDLFYISVQMAAVVMALKTLVEANVEFERSMTQVATMLDDSAMVLMPRYREEILKLSTETGKNANDLAASLFDVLSAAIPPTDAMQVVKEANELAMSTFIDAKQAADPLITAMNVYGKSADELRDVSDKLFAAYDRGVFSMAELSQSFGNIASTAKVAGVSFEELMAMMMLLTRSGIKLDEAVTSIQGLLKVFANPTVEATKALRQYERAYKDLTLELHPAYVAQHGMLEVLRQMGQLSVQERNNLIGRIEGIKAVSVLIPNLTKYEQDLAAVMEASGQVENANKKVRQDTQHQLEKLKESFNRLRIEYGKVSFPVSAFTGIINHLSTFDKSMTTAIGSTVELGIAATGIVSAIYIFRNALFALNQVSPGLGLLAKSIGGVTAAVIAFAEGMRFAQWAWKEGPEWLRNFYDWWLGERNPELILEETLEQKKNTEVIAKKIATYRELMGVLKEYGMTEEQAQRALSFQTGGKVPIKAPEFEKTEGGMYTRDQNMLYDVSLEKLKQILDMYKRLSAAEKARVGTPITAEEEKLIKILSDTEGLYVKRKRLIQEIADAEQGMIHAPSDESRKKHLEEQAALMKELAQVEKQIASQEKAAASARQKELDEEAAHRNKANKFRYELAARLQREDDQRRKEMERIEKDMIENVKFEWKGYYDWKKRQITDDYARYVELLKLREYDEKKLQEGLEAGWIFYQERVKELDRDKADFDKKATKEWRKVWEDAMEEIREAFSDMFEDVFNVFEEEEFKFEDLLDNFLNGLRDAIQKAVSEMLAYKLMVATLGEDFANFGTGGGKGQEGFEIGGWIGKGLEAIGIPTGKKSSKIKYTEEGPTMENAGLMSTEKEQTYEPETTSAGGIGNLFGDIFGQDLMSSIIKPQTTEQTAQPTAVAPAIQQSTTTPQANPSVVPGAETITSGQTSTTKKMPSAPKIQNPFKNIGTWINALFSGIMGGMNISGMFNTGTTTAATSGMSNPSFMMAASGAVVDRPTIMVAGERGPEVILPLKRGAARVTGGDSPSRSIVINANISAMDSASFSAFAEKNRGVFERQIVTSVSQNPNIRRRMRKAL